MHIFKFKVNLQFFFSGLYIRRIIILFDKLSFSQVVGIYQTFKVYYEKYLKKQHILELKEEPVKSVNDMDCSMSMKSITSIEPLKQISQDDLER